MTDNFDSKKSYRFIKSSEGMIAFSGFKLSMPPNGTEKEGVLKISSSERAYKGDYFTLTFLLDIEGDTAMRAELIRRFDELTESSLAPYLGRELEKLVKIPLDEVAELKGWCVEEVSIFLRTLKGEEKILVEQILLPAFETLLDCRFYPVEWWPRIRQGLEPEWPNNTPFRSFRNLFREWLGLKGE